MNRNHAVAAMFILLCLVFTAGCTYTIQSDLFIVKLYGNGTFGWIQVIDSGMGTSVIETDNGGYLISGGSFPTNRGNPPRSTMVTPFVIQLSSQGHIERFNNYSYRNGEGLLSVFQNPDGSTEAVAESGVILTLDQEGNLKRNTTQLERKISGVIRTSDDGYLMAGSFSTRNGSFCRFSKIDKTGAVLWVQDVQSITCDGGYRMTESPDNDKYLAGPFIQHGKTNGWSISTVIVERGNASFTQIYESESQYYRPLVSGIFSRNDSIEFYYIPDFRGAIGVSDIYPEYSTTNLDSSSQVPRQDLIRFYSNGTLTINRTFKNHDGRLFYETEKGNDISVYEKVKGAAVYFRMVNTDPNGNTIWDKPFLTLRYRPAPTDFHETVTIKQIIQTSDEGYIILGQRQKTS